VDTRNKEFRTLVVTLVIVAALIALSIYGSLVLTPTSWSDEGVSLGAVAPAGLPPGSSETLLSRIGELISPVVAFLEVDGCGPQGRQRGSGVVVHAAGFIVTNAHVVEDAEWVCVSLEGRDQMRGTVYGSNPATDLALIKVEPSEPLPTVVLGDSDQLQVGEFVVAQGAPFGLRGSMSVGIISGLNRRVGLSDYEDYIVTDAAINRGNSGGPLVNLDGEVIGINTAILAGDGDQHGDTGYSGLGFAIPINVVRVVAGRMISEGGWESSARSMPQEDSAIDLEITVAHVISEGPGGAVVSRGTAFAISPDGHFLTNSHVVEAAEVVKLFTDDGGELTATILGQDPHTDLAVVAVAASFPTPDSPFGDSDALEVGEAVIAVGSSAPSRIVQAPASVTSVNVGGLGLATYQGLIEFDREIQPGSSGGPLVNRTGQVVGVLIASGKGDTDSVAAGAGFGYAIPINLAMEVAEALIDEGLVERSLAGFGGVPQPPGSIPGLTDGGGVLVLNLTPGGPAARAGLQRRDLIIEVDGEPIRDGRRWQQYELPQIPPGTTVVLTVLRGEERVRVELTLDQVSSEQGEGVGG
jgi:S1-C subfamily serine protease